MSKSHAGKRRKALLTTEKMMIGRWRQNQLFYAEAPAKANKISPPTLYSTEKPETKKAVSG